tara:strand:- start:529 stop:1011 length:483 start_codon:yes stop_codon:yes gene_type:complete
MAIYYGDGTNSGDGRTIQTVYGYGPTGETSSSSTSFVGTACSVDITPKASGNTIYISVYGGTCYAPVNDGISLTLYRKIGSGGYTAMHDTQGRPSQSFWRTFRNGATGQMGCAFQVKDADYSSTSTITYKVYMRSINGNTVQFNNHHRDASSIKAVEVAG